MKKITLIISILLTLVLLNAGEWNEYYFRFKLMDRSRLDYLNNIVSIDNVKGHYVYAYANDAQWADFAKENLSPQILTHPGINPEAKMATSPEAMRSWDTYPTYEAYVAMMYAFATNYPSLCQIVDAGTTVGGRKILFAKISDNVANSEAEPAVMYTSTMHGDETVGYILMLRLIDTLLSGHGTDTRLTNMVNNMEIWINPNANPDGTYYGGNSSVSGARRYNQNGLDLNRNFPNYDGSLNTGAIQAENTIMMNMALAKDWCLSANFHGGAEVVNYPWDFQYTLHVDDVWYHAISLDFASSAQSNGPAGYMTDVSSDGVTNGAQWYVTSGNRQDWTNYTARSREVTIELSSTKNPAASTLPNYWTYNYDALLTYLEQAMKGIHGVVKDVSGNPLNATITVQGHDGIYDTINTNPSLGTFYRLLSPGTYTLVISTPGYDDQVIPNVAVVANQITPLEVVFGEIPLQQNITLNPGWNSISFNVIPDNPATIIPSIQGLIQIKNTEYSYNPSLPTRFNTLANLSSEEGYWVNVSSASVLSLTGTAVETNNIALKTGWNYVGFQPQGALSVNAALSTVLPYLIEVRYQDSNWSRSELNIMEPGKAYWINVNQDCTLNYPE